MAKHVTISILLACFLIALPASAQTPIYEVSRGAMYAGLAFDLATTERALNHGFYEANPLLGQNRLQRISIASGTVLLTDWFTHQLARNGHPKLATVTNFIVGGAHIGAAAHNFVITRQLK